MVNNTDLNYVHVYLEGTINVDNFLLKFVEKKRVCPFCPLQLGAFDFEICFSRVGERWKKLLIKEKFQIVCNRCQL